MPLKSLSTMLSAFLVTVLVTAGVVATSTPAHAAVTATTNNLAIIKKNQQNTKPLEISITGMPASVLNVVFEFTYASINTNIPDGTNSDVFQTGTSAFAQCPGYLVSVKSEVSASGRCLTTSTKSFFNWSGAGTSGYVTTGQSFAAVFPAGSLNFSSQSTGYLNVKVNNVSAGFFTLTESTTTAQAALSVTSTTGTFGSPLTLATSGGSSNGAVSYSVANGTASGCAVSSVSLSSTTAGTCLVTATMAGNSTYDPVSSAQTTVTFAKAPRTLAFTSTDPITLAYGASRQVMAVPSPSTNPVDGTLTYFASGGCTVGSSSGLVTATSSTQQCTVSASISAGTNYLAADTTNNIVINSTRQNLTVTALGASVNYGTTYQTNFSTTGLVSPDALGSVTFEYVGINGTVYGPRADKPINAGAYRVIPTSAVFSSGTESNYNINFAHAFVEISKVNRSLNFTSSTAITVQYGNATTVTSLASIDPNDGTITYSLSGDSDACLVNATSGEVTVTKSTGTCKVFAAISEGVNTYSATTSSPIVVTVSARPITITSSSPSATVGGTFTPTFTVSSGTLVGSDAILGVTYTYSSASYTASTTAPTAIGTYTITPSAAGFSTGLSSNYTIVYATGTLTISAKMSRTINFVNTSYTVEFGDSQMVSVVVSDGPSDGSITYSARSSTACTVDESSGLIEVTSGVGSCEVEATVSEGIQYLNATTVVPVTVTVTPRVITITANALTVAYGSAVTPSYAITSGTMNGSDQISGVSYRYAGTGSTTFASSVTAPTGFGAYSITPSAAIFSAGSVANYTITYVAGTLTINQDSEPIVTMTLAAPVGTRVLGTTVSYSATGMQSTGRYELVIRSTPQVLSSGMMTSGSASGTTSIPSNLEAGWHTLTFVSTAPDGSTFSESMYLKVSASGMLLGTSESLPAELAFTGFDVSSMLLVATMMLMLGFAIIRMTVRTAQRRD